MYLFSLSLYKQILITYCVGLLSGLSWAPFGLWFLGVAGLSHLFCLGQKLPLGRWCAVSSAFFLGVHSVAHAWVASAFYIDMRFSLVASLCLFISLLLCLVAFSVFPAVLYFLCAALVPSKPSHSNTIRSVFLFAAMLTLGEYLRSLPFNGFTSGSIGYAFVETPIATFAPVFGLYGVSFVVYLLSATLAVVLMRVISINGYSFFHKQDSVRQLFSPALLLLLAIAVLTVVVDQMPWVSKTGQKINYKLLQTKEFDGVPASKQSEELEANRLVNRLSSSDAQITVTPETALHTSFDKLDDSVHRQLKSFPDQSERHRFLGVPTAVADGGRFNSVVHISSKQESLSWHNKVALMPFGEFGIPFFTWVGAAINRRNLDTRQGTISAPFPVLGTYLGTLICNEDATSGFSRERIHKWPNTSIILNPTSMQAAKSIYAVEQRLQMVQMRALEIGRPILRIADHARSAHIDEQGRVVQIATSHEPIDLNGFVYPTQGITPYVRWGNTTIILLCALIILTSILLEIQRGFNTQLTKSVESVKIS